MTRMLVVVASATGRTQLLADGFAEGARALGPALPRTLKTLKLTGSWVSRPTFTALPALPALPSLQTL